MQLEKLCALVGFVMLVPLGCSSDDPSEDEVTPDEAAFTAAQMVGYPDAVRTPAHPNRAHGQRSRGAIKRIVIHALDGYASSTVNAWKANRENKGIAAHYVVDRTGKIVQTISDLTVAYHTPNNNSNTIGIEHEDAVVVHGRTLFYETNPDWATDDQMTASAKLTAWLCHEYDVPCDRQHVFGHVEINTNHQDGEVRPGCWDYGWGAPHGDDRSRPQCKGNHSDPGEYFDWAKYMQLVKTASEALNSPE